MSKIAKVICVTEPTEYEKEINKALNEGYSIESHSTSCAYDSRNEYIQVIFTAIMTKSN